MNPSVESERTFLERVSHTYTSGNSSQSAAIRSLCLKTFVPYLKGGRALELGCSDGFMTQTLSNHVDHIDVVDGCAKFIEDAKQRGLKNVKFIYSLFEEFTALETEKYDYVFASWILEHVLDPVEVMKMARSVLKPKGLLLIAVPNARALSRQLAVHIGVLQDLKELTPNDHNHGHRRVYDRAVLNRDIEAAGFENVAQGGLMLKILADFQMDRLIDDGMLKEEHIQGLYTLGLEYPDLCGSLFSICRPKVGAGDQT